MKTWHFLARSAVLAGVCALFLSHGSSAAQETSVAALSKGTHFHGITVDQADPMRLYLATHHGLFRVDPDGRALRVSQRGDDFMGFTPHPRDPGILYASGHPAAGGNLGFMVSTDGGRSWTKLADGVGGPVDFHQIDVSKSDPKVIYGSYGDLQRSDDSGRTWRLVGKSPDGLIAIAASARSADTLYAATQRGLLVSRDGGRQWSPAFGTRQTATMVHVSPNGVIHAFIVGRGLVRASEPDLAWQVIGNGIGRDVILHFASAPDGQVVNAIVLDPDTRSQALKISRDGGSTWLRLGQP